MKGKEHYLGVGANESQLFFYEEITQWYRNELRYYIIVSIWQMQIILHSVWERLVNNGKGTILIPLDAVNIYDAEYT